MAPVSELIAGKRIVVCAGSGGVGKTTTSAAIALGMAAQGRRVAVVTIDPAKRLADALGLAALGNEPHRVDPARLARHGVELRGELWALQLDPKRTFDAFIERLAPDQRTRDEIFANRIYGQLSNAIAGTQEFAAIAKLHELDEEDDFDLLVLDTPPSRNALDFLDAPARLTHFFTGRAVRVFLRPAGLGGRLMAGGTGVVFSVLKRVTGVDLLEDLSVFFRDLSSLMDGITERARRVEALLADPATAFLLVTAPQHDPSQEAVWFHERLRAGGLPFGGLVVNRVQPPPGDGPLPPGLEPELAERVTVAAAELASLARRDAATLAWLRSALGDPPLVVVPLLDGDVHDVDGLARMRAHLFADGRGAGR